MGRSMMDGSSEICKIIWERSGEITSSQIHLTLSEILAKVNIKKTLFGKIRDSEGKRKRFLSTTETHHDIHVNCLGKKSKSEDTDREASKDNSNNRLEEAEHEESENLVKNLLDELQQCSEKTNNLIRSFQRYCSESVNELTRNEIMDLTPSSEFVLRYTDENDYMQVLKEIFESVDKLFLESVIEFLNEFFSELESLLKPEEDPFLKKLKRLLFETLPALQPYEICVIEGSRPYVVNDMKEMSDYVQNSRVGKDIINYTVISEVKLKHAPPLQFKAYIVQSIGLRKYWLFEIEMCEIPTDIEGVDLFSSFFKAVVTWALMVRDTDQEF
ncbi:9986_t:CDS:10 [Cetraspora pellucida]|uniref:9986_t:CDS:1 n=1 Tax=Cetraspora pellucida TaxID=1433469 RepID=A0A9N9HZ51_9GLOM|nr:9986_t:CDS:10 [Cetraspora pellucida]